MEGFVPVRTYGVQYRLECVPEWNIIMPGMGGRRVKHIRNQQQHRLQLNKIIITSQATCIIININISTVVELFDISFTRGIVQKLKSRFRPINHCDMENKSADKQL